MTPVSDDKEMRQIERVQTTIRLPKKLLEQIRQQADSMGISFNAAVIAIIRNGLGLHS